LVAGTSDSVVLPFSVATGAASEPWEIGHSADFLALSPEGEIIAANDDGRIARLSPDASGEVLGSTRIAAFNSLALGAKGIVVADIGDGIQRWAEGKELGFLPSGEKKLESVSASADGTRIATGADGIDSIRIWDPERGALLHTIENKIRNPQLITLFPDGKGLALVDDGRLYLWFEQVPAPLPADGEQQIEQSLGHFSSDSFVERQHARRAIIKLGPSAIPFLSDRESSSLEFGIQLAQVLHDLRAQLDNDLHKALDLDKDIISFVGSPDGEHWAATVDATHTSRLLFGKLDRGANSVEILHSFACPNSAESIAFSPDGKFLATGNRNSTRCLYRVLPAAVAE
jgi:WD40 repeat protein